MLAIEWPAPWGVSRSPNCILALDQPPSWERAEIKHLLNFIILSFLFGQANTNSYSYSYPYACSVKPMPKATLFLVCFGVPCPTVNSRIVSTHEEGFLDLLLTSSSHRTAKNEYLKCNSISLKMSKSKSNPINSFSLHEAVSSSLKRQHILGVVPPAMRFIPLGAFAAKELYERQMAKVEALQGPQDEPIFQIEAAAGSIESGPASRLWSCAVCHPTQSLSSHVSVKSIAFPSATMLPKLGQKPPVLGP